ncbi:MAG: hypothetical protein K2Y71_18700 [Xanthobacteraceae bacterium]|nr:hypothetical protein [Xanthobacteraceae bacterium]
MSRDAAPSTALERARIAYEQLKRREHDAAMKRRGRQRTRNIVLVVFLGFVVALGLGVSVYQGWMPTPLRSATNEQRAVDSSKFSETRTAPIRSFVKGNTCQEMHFSNDKGIYVKGALVPCEAESKKNALSDVMPLLPSSSGSGSSGKGQRMNSIRDTFNR